MMKGCENLLSTRRISRLERKFQNLQQKQEETLAQIRKDKKEARKKIESERLYFIARTIKQSGFPVDQPAILIGAILAAKEKLDSGDCANEINRYIDLYNDFAKRKMITVNDEEESDLEEEVRTSGNSEYRK